MNNIMHKQFLNLAFLKALHNGERVIEPYKTVKAEPVIIIFDIQIKIFQELNFIFVDVYSIQSLKYFSSSS